MGCEAMSRNATAPEPGVAPPIGSLPGGQDIDPRAVAQDLVRRFGAGGIDPRVPEIVPGFDAPFYQAGLAGYSDAAMRIIARRHGCPFCVTEALLDQTLLAGGRGFAKADLGDIAENIPGGAEDHPLAGQIMGSDPREMAVAAIKMIEQATRQAKEYRKLVKQAPGIRHRAADELGSGAAPDACCPMPDASCSFASIDVNLACPVKKIRTKARGGHWLAQPEGAIAILEAVREAVPKEIAVTVKMRRSYSDTPEMRENFFRLFDAAYDMGCAWVTVHGRTVEQKYVGPSRWDMLREIAKREHPGRVRERVVFGSGDIWTAADVFRMIAYTGVTGVSVARGCIGNPWIFRECRDMLEGRAPRSPSIAEQRDVLEEHFRLALAVNAGMRDPELHTSKTMRKFGIQFARHHPRRDEVKAGFVRVKSLEEWRDVLDRWYGDALPEPAYAEA